MTAGAGGRLGVGIVGAGWCAAEHIKAFQQNPDARIVAVCSRSEARARRSLTACGVASVDGLQFIRRYEHLLARPDIDIVSIATPNHLHAEQAVSAARAGKHFLLEKPTGLDVAELVRIRNAVRRSGVITIVSFVLHYNPLVAFAHWLREAGWLGEIRCARFSYLSRITDEYAGWSWCRTAKSGRSHLLAAGCHAVDGLRWCSGLEPEEVTAYHTRFTRGYQWPTSIVVNLKLGGRALGQVVSSTDFMTPYRFGLELMGDRATIVDDRITWHDDPIDIDRLRAENPFPDVVLRDDRTTGGSPSLRVGCVLPDSGDVSHHPFQAEVNELVDCVRRGRSTHLDIFDAQKTMEVCLAADRSATRGGRPVRLPLIRSAAP